LRRRKKKRHEERFYKKKEKAYPPFTFPSQETVVDGMLPVEEFFELFGLEDLLEESEGNYHTVGGFVITQLGKIPAAADHFEWQNLRIEVMDMDGNRVDKVLIVPPTLTENNPLSEPQ
jgi:putative hemolysin